MIRHRSWSIIFVYHSKRWWMKYVFNPIRNWIFWKSSLNNKKKSVSKRKFHRIKLFFVQHRASVVYQKITSMTILVYVSLFSKIASSVLKYQPKTNENIFAYISDNTGDCLLSLSVSYIFIWDINIYIDVFCAHFCLHFLLLFSNEYKVIVFRRVWYILLLKNINKPNGIDNFNDEMTN